MTAAAVATRAVAATVTITADQPLALGRAPQTGQLRDSFAVVPGSVLRGALAGRWIRRYGPPSTVPQRQAFLRLFDSGEFRFGPLYPAGCGPRWLSLLRHKYGRPAGCTEPDVDLAETVDRPSVCPECGTPLEPARPGVAGSGDESLLAERTHAALDEDERAAEGQLFTRRRVRRGTRLTGLIVGPHDALAGLLDDPQPLLFGGNRTASGRVSLHWSVTATPPQHAAGTRVTLRLTSPAVFVDELGRPSRTPDLAQLSDLLAVQVTGIPQRWVRTETVGGWHAASGLPKPAERAVVAGCVFVLECAEPPTDDRLERLVREGIGLRRHEGFGWVTAGNDETPAI